jgi:hypothetical protein
VFRCSTRQSAPARRGGISRMPRRRHRQLVDLRDRWRGSAVDHDQWCASGRHDKVGEQLGVELRRASAEFVRQHTGQPIGGVARWSSGTHFTIIDRALTDSTSSGPQAAFRTRSSR